MRYRPHFGKVYQDAAGYLAKTKITGRAFNTFFALVAMAEWNGFVYKSTVELAKYLDMDASNVAKNINELVRVGLIKKGKRKRYFQISSSFIQFGKGFQFQALDEDEETSDAEELESKKALLLKSLENT